MDKGSTCPTSEDPGGAREQTGFFSENIGGNIRRKYIDSGDFEKKNDIEQQREE